MGPLPLNIGKINRLAHAHVLAVCVYSVLRVPNVL